MKKLIYLLSLLLLTATSSFAQQPLVLSMDKAKWTLDVGGLYNTVPTEGGIALAFTFAQWYPRYGGLWDGYLTTGLKPSRSFLQTQTLTLHIRVTTLTGAPYFHTDDWSDNVCPPCCTPAHFRPYFTSGPIYGKDFTRWWSNPVAATLVSPTDVTITTTFDPSQWSGVNGELGSQYPVKFAASLANVKFIGATMGGGCFFGHGVSTDGGTAMLELISYEIQ